MNFGKTILELRKQKNVTQDEMAAELGVSAAAVSKWENGYTLPDILMLCALADYFQVTTDELLGRDKDVIYAVIAAETQALGRQIETLAKRYGIHVKEIYENYSEALTAAEADNTVRYLIVGYHEGFCDDSHISKLVSFSPTDQEILDGFQWVFENCLD